MSYWSKQVIAREVELEKMRRAKPKMSEGEENLQKPVKEKPAAPTDPKALPNHLQRLTPKAISSKPAQVVRFLTVFSYEKLIKTCFNQQISKDFFGRVTTKSSVASSQGEGKKNFIEVKIRIIEIFVSQISTPTCSLKVRFGTSSRKASTTRSEQTSHCRIFFNLPIFHPIVLRENKICKPFNSYNFSFSTFLFSIVFRGGGNGLRWEAKLQVSVLNINFEVLDV